MATRLETLFPTALIALVGDEAIQRGLKQARGKLGQNWKRGVQGSRRRLQPIRRAARRELQKGRKLESMVPFFPAVPVIPVAIVTGLATFATVMAVRGGRRHRAIEARLDAIERELAMWRAEHENLAVEEGMQPAQLPWS